MNKPDYFGKDYIGRNPTNTRGMNALYMDRFGLSRSQMNQVFIGNFDKNIKILEVGCSIGVQLRILQEMGFANLYGIELNSYAVVLSKLENRYLNIIEGDASNLPFRDHYFDLVYTSGLLIHTEPSLILNVISEVYRCSKRYIWGFEYYSPQYTEIKWRGLEGMLWKADFRKIYQDTFPNLSLVKQEFYKYKDSENVDNMFLLEKI